MTGMLMLTMIFLQVAEGPQNVMTLQWVIITALAGVCVILFRLLQKANENNSDNQTELLEKTLAGLTETTSAVDGLANAIEVFLQQFSIARELDKLRQDLKNANKKD